MSTPQETASETLPKALNDRASTEDSLNFEPYVEVLESFLLHASRPLTVSIEGEWGSGKSSFMRQLEDRLSVRGHATVEFNPWRYQAEEVLWTAFILAFIDQITEGLGTWGRLRARLKLLAIRSRHEWRRTLLWAGATLVLSLVVWTLLSGLSEGTAQSILALLGEAPPGELFGSQGGTILAPLGATAVSGIAFVLWMRRNVVERIKEGVESYHTSAAYEDRVSFIERFHEDFAQLLDAYVGRDQPVFVFVDDLDRCEASKIADVVESIHLMLADDARLVFLLGMDRQKVAGALAAKHRDLLPYLHPEEEGNAGLDYGHRYLEKFVQIPFTVPQIATESATDLVETAATTGKSAATGDEDGRRGVVRTVRSVVETTVVYRKLLLMFLFDSFLKFYSILTRIGLGSRVETNESIQYYQNSKRFFLESAFPEKFQEKRELERLQRKPAWATVRGWTDQGFQRVIQLVTPALDRNPRRLKRFVNLYTLTTLLLSAKRDRQDRSEAETLVEGDATMEQIGKFVAITLRWPGLFGEIQKNTWLLEALTLVALWRRYDEAYVWWRQYYETQSRTDNATGATEEPADRDEEVEAGTPETRVVNEVESLTTELPEDEISVLLDLLIAGMYSDEGEDDRTDEDRQERSSTNPLHDEFESVARKFRTKFQTHDGVEFFEEVGVARIQTLTGVDETYSLANEDIVRTLLEASPSTTVLGEQQYEKILEYRDQLTRNQKDTRIRLRLANLLATRGRVDEAEKHYRTALEHSPKTTEPHSAYATFLSKRNRPAEAEQQYKAAIRTNPGNEFSYYEYADFLEAQDRHEEAEEQYRIALDLDPEGVTTHTRYADFLKRRNRLDEAEELYRITLDLTSDSPYRSVYGVHTGLAEVLVRQERLEEAEEQYRAALELNPDNWRSNYGFADLLARQGRDDEAEHHYRKGMELEPIRPEPYRAYAEFLRKRGRDEEAEPYERRAERYEQ